MGRTAQAHRRPQPVLRRDEGRTLQPELLRPILAGLEFPGTLHVVEGRRPLAAPASLRVSRPEDSYPVIAEAVAAFISGAAAMTV